MKYLAGFSLCAVTLLAGEAFWDAKPFATWTDPEVKQLMTSSPWAHEVPLDEATGADWQTASLNAGRRIGHSANFSNAAPGTTKNASKLKAVVFWESALPGRQALARLKFGAEAAESREARSLLEPEEEHYVIVVTGIPDALVKKDLEKLKEIAVAKTLLTVKGHTAEKPAKVEVFRDGKTIGMYFEFPRAIGIAPIDKDVEFATKLDAMDIKTLFHPTEMTVAGKMEL